MTKLVVYLRVESDSFPPGQVLYEKVTFLNALEENLPQLIKGATEELTQRAVASANLFAMGKTSQEINALSEKYDAETRKINASSVETKETNVTE